jgi:hypothetical protein
VCTPADPAAFVAAVGEKPRSRRSKRRRPSRLDAVETAEEVHWRAIESREGRVDVLRVRALLDVVEPWNRRQRRSSNLWAV